MHCQFFFEIVLSARTLGVPLSIVDRERKSVYRQEIARTATFGTMKRKEQRSRRVVLAL